MLKKPVAGKVKTRLSSHYGARGAVRIHSRLVERLLAQIGGLNNADIYLSVSPDRIHSRLWRWSRFYGLKTRVQAPGDLGEKMRAECNGLLNDYRSVIIIGTDCPGIDARILEQCISLLKTNDVVIGPAEDGGYYLVGMRQCTDVLFRNMEWGSGRVLSETRKRLHKSRLRYACLECLYDVDRPTDVRRMKRSLAIQGKAGGWML